LGRGVQAAFIDSIKPMKAYEEIIDFIAADTMTRRVITYQPSEAAKTHDQAIHLARRRKFIY
jgi:hypothetical protein